MAIGVDRSSANSTNSRQTSDEQPAETGSAPNATDDREQRERTVAGEFKRLLDQSRELQEYCSYFMTAKTDGVKSSLRHFALLMGLAAIGFVVIGGLIIIGSWLMFSGIANGVGELFGNRLWLGNLVTGALLWAGLGIGMYYAVTKRNKIACERTAQKYETRQARQHAEFGSNVAERAAAARSQSK